MSTTVVDAAFRNRLTQVIHSYGSVVSLAATVGVSDNAIYKWLAGRGQPSVGNLVALARAGRVSVEWLATGAESAQSKPAAAHSVEGSDFIFMPRNRIRFSGARSRIIRSEQVVDSIAFRASWIKQRFRADPRDLILIEAEGDTMAPTIEDSDLMLASLAEPRFRQDGIYLLRRENGIEVKRIQRRQDGKLVLSSDNQRYEAMVVSSVGIVGRVIWTGGAV
jgi:phage repressor protein C with HTH and peptisase S24 domain